MVLEKIDSSMKQGGSKMKRMLNFGQKIVFQKIEN